MSLETFTAKAGADLSSFQYRLVRLSAANTINVASLATDADLCGVLQNKPKSGEAGTVAILGAGRVLAGAAISVGDHLTCDGSGKAITVASGQVAVAQALEAAGAENDIIDAVIHPPVKWFSTP